MASYKVGDRVLNVETKDRGVITRVFPPNRGRQLYKVKYDNKEVDEQSFKLLPDVDLTDPFERCKLHLFGNYRDYTIRNTSFKIRNSNNNTISSLKASKTIFKPYQFKPLLKFLNSWNRRLLIADEVGLGKTIEAGHIMLELKARGDLHNALIVCPKSLQKKWANELSEKFGLPFYVIDNKEELLYAFNNHNGKVQVVVNYEKLSGRSELVNYIEKNNIQFSMVVCDESHKLKNRKTNRYKGIDRILKQTDCAVFMSATPIMLQEEDLFNQLHLLDEGTYDNREIFYNSIQLNRPFVRALSQLNSGVALSVIADELEKSEVILQSNINDYSTEQILNIHDYFCDYPIYQRIMEDLRGGADSAILRSKIQYNLSEMNPMNSIFSRTRKREITQDWSQAQRRSHTIEIELSENEKKQYEKTINEYGKADLGLTQVERQLASSVWAYLSDTLPNGDIDDFEELEDAKFNTLLSILEKVFERKKKVIVFAIFKKTIKYLSIRLSKHGIENVYFYGDPEIDKHKVLNRFQEEENIRVLLASEIGGEGLDMQFCDTMVNYDLPWNPMVVEQRIGRIDRLGQKSPVVNIYNLVVNNSILQRIYSRLLDRIGIFKESIGELEPILESQMKYDGETVTIQKAIERFSDARYLYSLTPEERTRKQEEILRAIETERINLKTIESGLTNALTNDSYFRNEIDRIINRKSYVTEEELFHFISWIVENKLTTCDLSQTKDDDVFEMRIPKSSPDVMIQLLERYKPHDEEGVRFFNRYIDTIKGANLLKITYNQEKAYEDKSLDYINMYHPLIQAGIGFFEEKQDKSECTFLFQIDRSVVPDGFMPGMYIMVNYRLGIQRIQYEKKVATEIMYPVLYDIQSDLIVEQEKAEAFFGLTQVKGSYIPYDESLFLPDETIDKIRYDINEYVDEYIDGFREDLRVRLENTRMMRSEQIRRYYDSRIKNMENSIAKQIIEIAQQGQDITSTVRLLNSNREELMSKKEKELEAINRDPELKVTKELIIAFSLIKVV